MFESLGNKNTCKVPAGNNIMVHSSLLAGGYELSGITETILDLENQ